MDIAIQATQLLLSLSLLIVLHEFGHFIPARLFGTRVEKFYLFFDYKWSLFKKKIGETEWGIGWIPLGGYVKIAGMIDESMDKEQMKGPAQPWEFRSKPAWQRLIIMVGGVTVNLLLGYFIYVMMMWTYGELKLPNENLTDGVMVVHPTAKELGFQNGDKILSVRGEKVKYYEDLFEAIIIDQGQVLIERGGQEIAIDIPEDAIGRLSDANKRGLSFFAKRFPFIIAEESDSTQNPGVFQEKDKVLAIAGQPIEYYDEGRSIFEGHAGKTVNVKIEQADGNTVEREALVNEKGRIGVVALIPSSTEMHKAGLYEFERLEYDFLSAWPAGWRKTTKTISSYWKQLKKIVNPASGAYKGLGGFGAIGGLYPKTWDWHRFWEITAFISLILAIMNILPIPVLDGGHVMFLLYEIVTGREPNQKLLEYAQLVGFVLLIALLLYANGNDIYQWLKP